LVEINEVDKPQVHDLLQIDPAFFPSGSFAEPRWVRETLIACPWVVVRRAQPSFGQIAVGVRGATRRERWGALCDASQVRTIVHPEQLRFSGARTPVLRALQRIRDRWADLALSWGPTGSVGFELATGRRVTTEASDLDLVIRAPQRIPVERARSLLDRTLGLEAKVDVRVETPLCGFALAEYALASSPRILLRYAEGVRVGEDPWQVES
jgi:phosphoribosyl-dephospho-CoA transferase